MTKLKVEFEMDEMDIGNVLSVPIEHETAMKYRMQEYKCRPDGTWARQVDEGNFAWYQGHVQYLAQLRKVIVAGIKRPGE